MNTIDGYTGLYPSPRKRGTEMNEVIVKKLGTNKEAVYIGITPRKAVIAAYAQERNDYNTWNYISKYDSMVQETVNVVTCGNWTALKDQSIYDKRSGKLT